MEYQKTLNLLDNTPSQPTKFRTKKWVETNDEELERKTPIVKLNLKLQIYVIIVMYIYLQLEL